jgi:hypothetical protein
MHAEKLALRGMSRHSLMRQSITVTQGPIDKSYNLRKGECQARPSMLQAKNENHPLTFPSSSATTQNSLASFMRNAMRSREACMFQSISGCRQKGCLPIAAQNLLKEKNRIEMHIPDTTSTLTASSSGYDPASSAATASRCREESTLRKANSSPMIKSLEAKKRAKTASAFRYVVLPTGGGDAVPERFDRACSVEDLLCCFRQLPDDLGRTRRVVPL